MATTQADRLSRMARVADVGVPVLGDEGRFQRWLITPSRYLGDVPPIELLDTDAGAELVLESLHAIGYGGVG